MSFETREEVLERVMSMPKPACPHCKKEMSLWEVPPINFSDGLGWGTPFLYVCFNDECPYYVRGWDKMYRDTLQGMSYRLMYNPEKDRCMPIPVPSPHALKDGIIQ